MKIDVDIQGARHRPVLMMGRGPGGGPFERAGFVMRVVS
jgi:hypothetical protein